MSWLKNNKKKAVLIVLVVFALGAYLGVKQMYKPHKTVAQREVAYTGGTAQLLEKVKASPENWQDVVVNITGKLTSIDGQTITLDNGIFCQLEKPIKNISTGNAITVKGRIIGYDDLLEELKMDQVVIGNN